MLLKIIQFIDYLLYWLMLIFIFIFPSIHSKMCYSHCIVPKEFAIYLGTCVFGLIATFLFIFKSYFYKIRIPKPIVLAYFFILSLALSLVSTLLPQVVTYKIHYHLVLWILAGLYAYIAFNDIKRSENILLAILLSGIFPAIVLIGEAFNIKQLHIWQNTNLSGLTTRETYVSTFGNPDFAAPFFGIMCILNIRFLLFSTNKIQKIFFWILQILFTISLFLPLCRSAIIALIISLLAYFLFLKKNFPNKILSFINIIMLFVIMIFLIQLKDMVLLSNETLFSRIYNLFFNNETLSKRLYMLECGLKIIKDNLWFGIGTGTMLLNFPIYAQFINQDTTLWKAVPPFFNPEHLHNEFINLFAENGIFSFILFIILITLAIYFSIKFSTIKPDKFEILSILGLVILYIIIDSCFNVTFNLPHIELLFAISILLIFSLVPFEKNNCIIFDFTSLKLKIVISILFWLFLFISVIFGIKYIKADWYIMQGKICEVKQNLNYALKFYEMSYTIFPNKAEPYVFSAYIYNQLGKYNDAILMLQKASNLNLSLPIVYELARLATRYLDLNSELRYLYFLTKAYPRFDEGHYLLGLRYLKEKKSNPNAYKLAEECFLTALNINPKHISIKVSLAELYFETLRYKEAINELNEVLALSPKLQNAIYLKSKIKGFFFDEI